MSTLNISDWIMIILLDCTECPKIYQKSVLHLLKYTTNLYSNKCSTDLRYILGHLVFQSGVVLETLDAEVGKHGLMVPLDLGAKGQHALSVGGSQAPP